MNDEFEDSLKSRITDLFDNYEDGSADKGWQLLRERFPEKKKHRPTAWLWWSSAAALLVAVTSAGLWMRGGFFGNERKFSSTKAGVSYDMPSAGKMAKGNLAPPSAQNFQKLSVKRTNEDRSKLTAGKSRVLLPSEQNLADNWPHPSLKHFHTPRAASARLPVKMFAETVVKPFADQQKKALEYAGFNVRSDTQTNQLSDTLQFAENSSDKIAQKNIERMPLASPFLREPGKNMFISTAPENEPVKKDIDKKVKFGMYAATYFNYAKGSDNEFNVGAGLISEVRIAGGLKLVTGVGLNQNSLKYKSPLSPTVNSFLLTNALRRQSLFTANVFPNLSANTASKLVLQNYQANLIGLDIPLNLKFQFSESDQYLSAGVSSGTYVNETYQYFYSYQSLPFTKNDKIQNSFSSFDFARTLNLSFGMGYRLGKANRIVIEPFVKYPLDGLGSQQLKFGAGGVNLKFNFLVNKKQSL